MDLGSIATLLSSLKTATDIAKLIKDSDLSLEKAETKLKLAELISALADAKIEAAEIQQALAEKDSELRGLREQLETRDKLEWDDPYYWHKTETGRVGPYCQQCYDKEQRLIRLQGNGEGWWECKTCKNNYTDARYRASAEIHSARSDWDPYER